MTVFIVVAIVIVLLYLIWIGLLFAGWNRIPGIKKTASSLPMVSVIVPVRNEESNLEELLDSLSFQDYPSSNYEIIIVDDHSTDCTPVIVKEYSRHHPEIKYVRMPPGNDGKALAVKIGVAESLADFVILTDADCRHQSNWVRTMIGKLTQTGADLVAGPVLVQPGTGLLERFQQLDSLAMTGSTAGSIHLGKPVMCSGANLGFRKDSYIAVLSSITRDISSGDDMALLSAMIKSGFNNIHFNKSRDAAVFIPATKALSEFLNQRRRWASNSRHHLSLPVILTALLVFTIHFIAVLFLFGSLFSIKCLIAALIIYVGKSIVDLPFLLRLSYHYYGKSGPVICFPVVQLLYFFYISFTAISSFTSPKHWKGREIINSGLLL